MKVVLFQVCVDERLNHELLRIQVKHKLAELYLNAPRILIVNELGGNMGRNFVNTARMLVNQKDDIVLSGVLHHTDCKADQAGLRLPIEQTMEQMETLLSELGVSGVLASGNIYTNNNHIIWLEDRHIVNKREDAKNATQGRD